MLQQLKEILENAQSVVFFGGAGVSTGSNIPDFRGNQGLYMGVKRKEDPENILSGRYLQRYPEKFFEYYKANMIYPDAQPNDAHLALAELERQGKLKAVITQNIDGLHQAGGSKNVIELHGSVMRNHCTRCGKKYPLSYIVSERGVPKCECGGIVRPDVVLYGESLDAKALAKAEEAISSADVLIVGGTSLTVQPAASLVTLFRGTHLVIINKTPTPYDRHADLILCQPIEDVFSISQ